MVLEGGMGMIDYRRVLAGWAEGTTFQSQTGSTPVPLRAIVWSAVALSVPVLNTLLVRGQPQELEFLLWLLALVPAFLLSYYRSWRGVAIALASGMAVLSTTQVIVVLVVEGLVPQWSALMAVTTAYVAIGIAVGWLSELLHRNRERAEALALTDELTRIPNRRHLRLVLEHDFAAAQRGRDLTVAIFDLDRFKNYNDRYGHAAGDIVLRVFGEMLDAGTRRMNLAGRYGGEEFMAILSDTDLERALHFVERVRKSTTALELPAGSISVSAGVATFRPGMRTADDLVAAADEALYRAKADGGDTIRVAAGQRVSEPAPSRPLPVRAEIA
jgi:diguanylate cyclase (GGDEF)-like protein